jgi:hypothetical protein
MNINLSAKQLKIALVILSVISIGISSCDKEADPELIKVSSTPIPGYTPTTPTLPVTPPTTPPGGGTTTPPDGGTTTPPGGGTTTPPDGGTTTPGTNTGDGGVAIGAANTIMVRLGTTDYMLKNPDDMLTFEVSKMGLIATTIGAGTPVSERSFGLLSGGTAVGLFDVQLVAVKVNGIEYLASQGDGKVKFTKVDVTDSNGKKGNVQGTFDVMATDINSGAKARIVGSFNVVQQ